MEAPGEAKVEAVVALVELKVAVVQAAMEQKVDLRAALAGSEVAGEFPQSMSLSASSNFFIYC